MSIHFVTNEKIAETSSKGNQEKWIDGGRWYKLDQFGYEALAETLISRLLRCSNIGRELPFRFTEYRMERIVAHGVERTGCSSENFLQPGQSIITLSHLYRRASTVPLRDILARQSSDKRRIAYLADATAELTGLTLFPQYLTLLFEVDALYGRQLNMPKLTREEILRYLEPLLPCYARRDRGIIADRVCATILLRQKYL